MNQVFLGLTVRAFVNSVLGGLVGGVLGTAFVVLITSLIKMALDWVLHQESWVTLISPFVGITLSALLLFSFAQGRARQVVVEEAAPPQGFRAWLRAPSNALRADLTGDVVRSAGREEQFPWRLAPLRALAIIFTVGSGAPMGTESPAAHLGVAAGASLGSAKGWLRAQVQSAAISGGAAGVAVLMGLPLVGLIFMLELGRRNHAPVSLLRVIPASCGALIGWAVNTIFQLDFVRLVVPDIGPQGIVQALVVALLIGAASGALSSVMGAAIYRARRWTSRPLIKVLLGCLVLLGCILLIRILASPDAAIGPGAGAISWAESAEASLWVLLAVAVLRAVATTAAVAAGAIAGGYRLPVTAIAMVLTLGGPLSARLTSVAAVIIAVGASALVGYFLDRFGVRK